MEDAVAGGHDRLTGRVGKGFKRWFGHFRTMAFIESPGMLVQDIGAEIEPLYLVGGVVRRKPDGFGLGLWALAGSEPPNRPQWKA